MTTSVLKILLKKYYNSMNVLNIEIFYIDTINIDNQVQLLDNVNYIYTGNLLRSLGICRLILISLFKDHNVFEKFVILNNVMQFSLSYVCILYYFQRYIF